MHLGWPDLQVPDLAQGMTGSSEQTGKIRAIHLAHRTAFGLALVLVLGALGFYALYGLLLEVRLHDVRASLRGLQGWQWVAALGLTSISYLLLTLYDVFALRIIGRPLPWRTAALASFTSYTLSHNLGLSFLTGGSARYRIYKASGLEGADIVRVIATASMAFWSGVVAMSGIALVLQAAPLAIGPIHLVRSTEQATGILILAAIAGLLWRARNGGQSLCLFGWALPLPTAAQALAQMVVASLDLAAASATLFVLVPGVSLQLFPAFFLGYGLALIIALISHVPGGLGIFEAVMIAVIPDVPKPELVAALIAYRSIYYLLPLLAASVLLAVHERHLWHKPVVRAFDASQVVVSRIAPIAFGALTFVGGVILLVSGSLPAIPHRLNALQGFVPLPFIEASHIAASLSGTGLLLLAPGLFKRLDGAFILTRIVLVAGAIFSLVKGFDYEEAIILLTITAVLQWTRVAFYRHTAFTVRTFSAGWIAAAAGAVGLSMWIGIFAFKHVSYQGDLWWEFAWRGDASRFLRASFATAVMLLAAVVVWFFGPAAPIEVQDCEPLPADCDAFAFCDRTDAMLAWTGDKLFQRSPSGNAFLMYQVQGHSWIVMGDPVGAKLEWPDLLWKFRERADAAQGRLLLYQLTQDALPIAIDLGMQLVKYGEEARVDLERFTLAGPDAKNLRYAERRAVREGASFELIEAKNLRATIGELSAISDGWLKAKNHKEKAFSVGRFDLNYLSRFDCAVVRHDGRIVAFANVWKSGDGRELSVDLMRHASEMPYGTMDFLFVRLMQWGQAHGYEWFNLGVAPLSGIEARRLAPIWTRASAFLYKHGDGFYGFEGLRAYKDKFSPIWEPRYIAGPQGVGLARALIDLQTLVGGGRGSAARRTSLAIAA